MTPSDGGRERELARRLREAGERLAIRRRLVESQPGLDLSRVPDDELARGLSGWLGRNVDAGRALPVPRKMPAVVPETDVEPPLSEAPSGFAESHEITWVLEDGAGLPRRGVDWIVLGPDGQQVAQGSTGDDGTVSVTEIVPDRHVLVVPDVDDVRWDDEHVAWGVGTTLRAKTSGLPDGTSAVVRIFERHREHDDEVLAELSGSVETDEVAVVWTPESPADAPWPDERLVVAEVSAGGHGLKTLDALVVRRPTRRVRWSSDEARESDFVDVIVAFEGIPDGEPFALEILDLSRAPPSVLVALEASPAQGGTSTTPWAVVVPAQEDEHPWLRPDLELAARLPPIDGLAACCSPVLVVRRGRLARLADE